MSSSPKKDNVEPAAVTPDGDEALMNRANDAQGEGHGDYGYAAEVKEQDRWLPIANGASISPCPLLLHDTCPYPDISARRRIATTRR